MSRSDLLLRQRQERILTLLQSDGRVLAADLAAEFQVSEDTVRRDLREMAAQGLCERVYGGALPPAPMHGNFSERLSVKADLKSGIAALAATQIEPGMAVFFDAGSTNLAIAKALDPALSITAITNAPLIASALLERPSGHVIVLGGVLDRHVGGAVGLPAIREMERLNPDLCILGACGIDATAGITAMTPNDAEFKSIAADRSRQILVAVTADKLGTAAAFHVADTARCTCLVTDHTALPSQTGAFSALGIRVLTASAHS